MKTPERGGLDRSVRVSVKAAIEDGDRYADLVRLDHGSADGGFRVDLHLDAGTVKDRSLGEVCRHEPGCVRRLDDALPDRIDCHDLKDALMPCLRVVRQAEVIGPVRNEIRLEIGRVRRRRECQAGIETSSTGDSTNEVSRANSISAIVASTVAAIVLILPAMADKLNDEQTYDRLYAALLALGGEEGQTVRGDTSLKAARQALVLLQMGLLKAMDDDSDRNVAIKAPGDV